MMGAASPILIPAINWQVVGPYIWLTAAAVALTAWAVGPVKLRRFTGVLSLAALVPPGIAAIKMWSATPATAVTLGGMVVMDRFAICFCLLFLATAALTILLSAPSSADQRAEDGTDHGEYYCLVLFATSGMMLMASSTNLVMIFLGLEILSLPLYILAGFTRWKDKSLEAATKYFLLGAFSTGFTVYGMALMYGATGTLDLSAMARIAAAGPPEAHGMLLLGSALALVGFLFKIAAFPFHYWLPDVYQGAPTPITAFMVAGTKAAAFAALLRLVWASPFWQGPHAEDWVRLLVVLAALTMTAGNAVALVQKNIKRMLAYSSIAHAGYLLVAVVSHSEQGVASVVFYLAVYLFMNLGAFGVVLAIDRARGGGGEGDLISSYAGLGWRHPLLAAAMTIFMFSLTGMPPTGGFVGKFYIFKAAMDSKLYGVAAVGLLNSVLGAAYYLNIVVTMYMKEPVSEPPPVHTAPLLKLGIIASTAGVLILGLFPARILEAARHLLL